MVSSILEALAIGISMALLLIFATGIAVCAILFAVLACAVVVLTSPFWFVLLLFRPELLTTVKGHATLR